MDEARRALVEEAQLEVVPYSITIGYPHLSADPCPHGACMPGYSLGCFQRLQARNVACGLVVESRVEKMH